MHLFTTRKATPEAIESLIRLFKDTVLTINRRDYSAAEVEDWASCADNRSKWEFLIATHYFIVALNHSEEIVGFSSLSEQGYLHSMFVHRNFQHQGVASLLLDKVESHAKQTGIATITSEVSITARPFFEKRGYKTVEEQQRQANRLRLTNYRMEKTIQP